MANLAAYLVLLALCLASQGDNDPSYVECVANCMTGRMCTANPSSALGLPFVLRLFGWNCQSNCQYDCMWLMVDQHRENGWSIFQYYGKWPFRRFFGVQEIASVIFSIGNAYAHCVGYRHFKTALGRSGAKSFFLTPFYRVYFIATIAAWAAATVFHTRDVKWTERADYLSAIVAVFIGLYNACLRHALVVDGTKQLLLAVPFLVLLAYHLHYMLCVSFDYGWNMTLLATMFGIFSAIWLVWGLANIRQRPYAKLVILWVAGALACGSLELFDFEPIADLVDAHALWHAGTIPLALLLWKIYTLDALELIENPSLVKSQHANL